MEGPHHRRFYLVVFEQVASQVSVPFYCRLHPAVLCCQAAARPLSASCATADSGITPDSRHTRLRNVPSRRQSWINATLLG